MDQRGGVVARKGCQYARGGDMHFFFLSRKYSMIVIVSLIWHRAITKEKYASEGTEKC